MDYIELQAASELTQDIIIKARKSSLESYHHTCANRTTVENLYPTCVQNPRVESFEYSIPECAHNHGVNSLEPSFSKYVQNPGVDSLENSIPEYAYKHGVKGLELSFPKCVHTSGNECFQNCFPTNSHNPYVVDGSLDSPYPTLAHEPCSEVASPTHKPNNVVKNRTEKQRQCECNSNIENQKFQESIKLSNCIGFGRTSCLPVTQSDCSNSRISERETGENLHWVESTGTGAQNSFTKLPSNQSSITNLSVSHNSITTSSSAQNSSCDKKLINKVCDCHVDLNSSSAEKNAFSNDILNGADPSLSANGVADLV